MNSSRMFYEFALDPHAIQKWSDFKSVIPYMGIEHGRLISKFPKRWQKWVIELADSCPENKPMQRQRIIECLTEVKKAMLRSGRAYDDQLDWIGNALAAHELKPFDCIITNSGQGDDVALSTDDLLPGEAKWDLPRERVIQKDVNSICSACEPLLVNSQEILIIDPFFSPYTEDWLETLKALLSIAFGPGIKTSRLEIHGRFDRQVAEEEGEYEQDCQNRLPDVIPSGAELKVFRWDYQTGGERPHARYVLTELGGLRYDYGVGAERGQVTDVSIVSGVVRQRRWDDYHEQSSPYELVESFTVKV